VALHVFSFSSEHDLPEQVASLRSFLANVGTPAEFTIVSDGTHSEARVALLRALHGCVSVVPWDRLVNRGLPRAVWRYVEHGRGGKAGALGRKLATVVSLPDDRPVLYTDSDILFFPAASELRKLSDEGGAGPRYLRDCKGGPFLDDRLLRNRREGKKGVNSGFFFHSEGLDWGPALARLERLPGSPRTFTEQTVVHLTMHWAGATPFDRSRYVMASGDRSLLRDPYLRPDTVLRHYTTRVRHKFWTAMALGAAPVGSGPPAGADHAAGRHQRPGATRVRHS
jgi:hypothetical protein